MNRTEKQHSPDVDIYLAQYTTKWKHIEYIDSQYVKIALLYIGLLGFYIGNISSFSMNKYMLALFLIMLSVCTLGIMARLRGIINQQFKIVSEINEKLSMVKEDCIFGIMSIRTSTYLSMIIVGLTLLATYLTMTKA